MTRSRWLAGAAFVLALIGAAPVAAEESPLAQVPDQAPIVLHIHGFRRTKDRLLTMVENALPDMAAQVRAQVDEGLKKSLKGREFKGLPPDGAIFVVFVELPRPGEEVPMAAILARVTSYAEFRDGILKEEERKTLKAEGGYEVATTENDKQIYFVDRKGWVVVSPRKEVAEQLAKVPQRSLETKLSKAESQKLVDADVTLYVDMEAINKAYGPQIKQGRFILEKMLEQGGSQPGGDAMKGMMQLMKGMYGAVFDAVEDGRSALFAVEFRPDGLALHGGVTVTADSKTGGLLKTFKPAAPQTLASLPVGLMIYSDLQLTPALSKLFQQLGAGVVEGDSGTSEEVKEGLAELADAKPRSMASAIGMPTSGLQVWDYEDPAKAVAGQLKLFKALKAGTGYQYAPLKEKPEVKANDREYRGFKLHHVRMVWDLEKMTETLPGAGKGMEEAIKKLVGEGLNVWFGTDGKAYVQASGKDWPTVKRYLDTYLDGKDTLGKQPPYLDTHKHLPAQATMVVLMDMPQYTHAIMEYMRDLMAAMAGKELPKAVAAPKTKPSYFGMTVTLEPGRGSFDVWVPGAGVDEIRKAVESMKEALP
jgi:hypothetical protein